MRLLPLLLVASAELGCAGSEDDDQVLLQTSTMTHIRSHNRVTMEGNPRLGSLLSTTRKLLKDGGTPQVITLADETLKEIKEDTLPAVQAAHENDQNLLNTEFGRFQDVSSKYDQTKTQLQGLRDADRVASSQHKQCRQEEVPLYEAYTQCEVERAALWAEYVVKHTAFKNGGLCEEGYGEDINSVDEAAYEVLVGKGQDSLAVLKAHEIKKKECITKKLAYDVHRTDCDGKKVHLEDLVCKSELFYTTELANMNDRWDEVTAAYADIKSSVLANAEQREQEVNALIEIRCLLTTIHNRGGKACADDEEGNVTAIIKQCQSDGEGEVDSVKIVAPEPPPRPVPAPAKPYPCSAEYLAQEYTETYMEKLPEMPACQECSISPVDPPKPPNVGPFSYGNVCLSARGDVHGTISVPAGACVTEVKYTVESGQVSCSGSGGMSSFGCGSDLIGLVLTDKDQKTVVWPHQGVVEGMTKTSHGHAHWYKQAGVGQHTQVMDQKVASGQAPLKSNGDFDVWYNEDLSGGTEGDNAGTACYTVEVKTTAAGVTC